VIDRDRVEEHNVGTQLYGESDVGAWKVEVLKQRIFRATGVEIEGHRKELDDRTARSLLQDGGLVIDTFDNSASRRMVQEHCRALRLSCLHVGLYADYAEVIWDERYRVPRDVAGDVCDYPLARNLVLLAVAVASEVLVRSVLVGDRQDLSATLRDFSVRSLE
jgi:molybdopterin/thiamine biosynthesis adenylyltransferase